MPLECDYCDYKSAVGSSENLPEGWIKRTTKLGEMNTCPTCAPKETKAQPPSSTSFMDFDADDIVAPQALTETTKDKLRSYVMRIENLESEISEIMDQKADVYADAKALGFDTKALRHVISLRRKDQKTRQEDEMMVDLYLHALGEI